MVAALLGAAASVANGQQAFKTPEDAATALATAAKADEGSRNLVPTRQNVGHPPRKFSAVPPRLRRCAEQMRREGSDWPARSTLLQPARKAGRLYRPS